jgi:predicted ATPase
MIPCDWRVACSRRAGRESTGRALAQVAKLKPPTVDATSEHATRKHRIRWPMLTRIEIDGFKTFEGFGLDLMPLCVVTGPNAVGKSNLFDAIRLLSRMVSLPDLGQAFADLRGRPSEQFRSVPGNTATTRMTFAVECLLDPFVEDAFGNRFEVTDSRIRYEITIERRVDPMTEIERLFVASEAASRITKTDDRWSQSFCRRFPDLAGRVRYGARRSRFLSTERNTHGVPVIVARQDGVQGRPRPLPAHRATATYLSTVNDAGSFGHLYALRKSLTEIMFLHADPVAERRPVDFNVTPALQPDAGNLAAVLHRIKKQTATPARPAGVLADISMDLSSLVPGLLRVDVASNDQARQFELSAQLRNGQVFSSRILSDGTLRLLALVTVANDPERPGIFCFEEPENGVSEARIGPLIDLFRGSCEEPGDTLFQVLMNSHSPRVFEALRDHELIVADLQTVTGSDGSARRRTRMRTTVAGELFPDDPDARLSTMEAQLLLANSEVESA